MANPPPDGFWPASLAHLAGPYITPADEYVTIAEISSEPVNGFTGYRCLFTALVPNNEINQVLVAPGGIGTEIRCWGPYPCVDPEGGYDASFSIDGPAGSSKKYETIINSWLHHNKIVIVPDNGLLLCYGLVPRILKENGLSWDDPSKPIYDVIRVVPLSCYSVESGYTTARITIRKEYLEDYLSLKGCVGVATFFEERYSSGDPGIEDLLGTEEITEFNLPGRQLTVRRANSRFGNQLSQVWGCAPMLVPAGRPISEEKEPVLTWPDRQGSVTGRDLRVFASVMEFAYIRDEVLAEYEEREEFDVSPESGLVSYNGWWAVSYGRRHGRNHLAIELRKLYEGVPVYIIRHYNKFAVPREVAEKDRQVHGSRHIGNRAKDVVYGFLDLTAALADLSDRIGLAATQEDIGRFTTAVVEYQGWWRFPPLRRLGQIVPMAMSHSNFLRRCKELFKLLENIQPAPLRQLLSYLGMKKEHIKDFGSLKLLATFCQLARIAEHDGFHLVSEFAQIYAQWNASFRLTELEPLFALNSLRTAEAHISSTSTPERVRKALDSFAIDETECRIGWGLALDKVYDRLSTSLTDVARLVRDTPI
jgi:hypothetical protein